MTPMPESGHPAVRRRQPKERGPTLLVTMADLRKLERPWITTADVLELFREAQRLGR